MEVNIVFLHCYVNNMKTVIPVKAGIQIQKNGFRIKSGMTQCVKSFLRHYAEIVLLIVRRS
jgi:hypothetical protein